MNKKEKSIDLLYEMMQSSKRSGKTSEITEQKIKSVIASSFYELHKDIKKALHTHYWLPGGRGSTKSSFISIEIIKGMMDDPNANAIAFRKVGETLEESVYEQLLWAIDALGVEDKWHATKKPLRITYKPTGQRIIFRGLDKAKKSKSIKLKKGYFKFIWFEETDEFSGMQELRTVLQSLMRGGKNFIVFYSYNPPKSQRNWVNSEIKQTRPDRIVTHSTYLTVPREWLGEQFYIEADHLNKTKPDNYRHEYLGEVIGTGAEVFANITIRIVPDSEIAALPRRRYGIDWGYASDPFVFISCGYDRKKRRLVIFDEVYQAGLSNYKATGEIKKHNGLGKDIIADSAEPKSIAELNSYGLHVRPSKKYPGSVEFGIQWLQGLEEIIIDNKRCPEAAREFNDYELDRDANDNLKAEFPDKKNHTIDGIRYACQDDMEKVRVK